jgi:hypothetical protein
MANTLGQLLVELGINTVAFHGGLDKATYAAKKFGGDLKGMFADLRNSMSSLGSELGASFGPLGGILDGVVRGVGQVSSSVSAMGSGAPIMMGLAGAAAGIGVAAAGAAIGLEKMSEAGMKVVEELEFTHLKLGISIADLQVFQAAGASVDVPLQTMVRGFRTFEKALADSTGRMTPAQIALRNLGVTAREPKEAFEQAAEAISKIEDPTVRMADATALFGRMGMQMLPFLMKGKAGFEEYEEAVKKFGPTIDKDAIKATEDFRKATVDLGLVWDKAKVSLISPWVGQFKEALAEGANEVINFANAEAYLYGIISKPPGGGHVVTEDEKNINRVLAEQKQIREEINASLKMQYDNIKAGGVEERKLVDLKDLEKAELAKGEDIQYNVLLSIEDQIKAQTVLADIEKKNNEEEKKQREALLDIDKRNKSDFGKTKDVFGNEVTMRRDKIARDELNKKKEKDAEEEQHQLDEIQKTFEKDARERMSLTEQEGLKNIQNAEKELAARASLKKEEVTGKSDLGVIGKKEEQQELLAIDQEELAEYRAMNANKLTILAQYLSDERAIQASKGGPGADLEADKNVTRAQEAFNAAMTEGRDKVDAMTGAINREKVALAKSPFTDFIKSTKDVRTALQENVVNALHSVSSGLAKSIVEGKNFGAAMKQVGQQAAEAFLEMELKRLMAHIMTEIGLTGATITGVTTREAVTSASAHKDIMKDAKKAGAKGWTIGEEFPFPLNVIMPPILATAMFAGVMAYDAFEGGGIVGQTGFAKLHENEMVLPRPIAEKVQAMADPDRSVGGRGRQTSVVMNINTPNADSFRRSQSQIQAKQHASAQKMAQRNGR